MKKLFYISRAAVCIMLILQSNAGHTQRGNFTMDYSNAQQFFTDINGRPLYLKVDYFIEGHPYHPDNYYLATIVMPGGKAYRDIPVKFNLMENLLIYRTPAGEELVSTVPAVRVIYTDSSGDAKMKDRIFERGYGTINDLSPNTWYEVLDTGEIQLLKHYKVDYTDQKQYNSPSITRVYFEKEDFFISLQDGTMKKLDKGVEEILAVLPDKKDRVRAFIAREDLKCKKETDWKKVIRYYNSLH